MDRHPDRAAVLASLRERWGAAAPRPATEVFGALAVAPGPADQPAIRSLSVTALPPGGRPALLPLPVTGTPDPAFDGLRARPVPAVTDRVIPTGFPSLDALLAAGGLPRAGTVALAGVGSSGATTLALRVLAEAQAGGALAAWVDLPRSLDPVEAVARGVNLEWLAVLVPDGIGQALSMAGTLLQARAVDILVLDLGAARASRPAATTPTTTTPITTVPAATPAATAPATPSDPGPARPASAQPRRPAGAAGRVRTAGRRAPSRPRAD